MIYIPVTPIPKPRMTRGDKWKQRPCVMRYREYKDEIRPYTTDLTKSVKVTFYLPMPSSWSKRKKIKHHHQLHRSKPDVDNLLKGLMDAWMDQDQEVASIWVEKRWAQHGAISITTIEGN